MLPYVLMLRIQSLLHVFIQQVTIDLVYISNDTAIETRERAVNNKNFFLLSCRGDEYKTPNP